MNRILGFFGPVLPGGDPRFPALLMLVVGLFGFLSVAIKIRKMESIRSQWPGIAFVVAILSFVMLLAVVVLSRGLNHHY